MIDLAALRHDLDERRAALDAATEAARAAGRRLDELRALGTLAGDGWEAASAGAREARAERERVAALVHERLATELVGAGPDELIGAVEPDLPIALLPLRLETAFAGPPEAPTLRIRIYPDEVHVEQHEPALTAAERDDGFAYWTAVTADPSHADAAWHSLAATHTAPRAEWIRERTTPIAPGSPPEFPPVETRTGAWTRPAVASTLPDQFVVRVRAGRFTTTVTTAAVADRLQMGIDPLALVDRAGPGDRPLTLDPGLAWMVDWSAAVAAGLGVEVALPAHTRHVDDVTVVGCCASLDPGRATERLAGLLTSHRFTAGAGFVEPGTPTNNLADSVSGADPTDGAGRPASTNLEDVAAAFGLGDAVAGLGELPGATRGDRADGGVVQRALFESTWGPYLRELAQPGFPLDAIAPFRRHVAEHVRGGVVLPNLRIGRQPYALVPVLPLDRWAPGSGEGGWFAGMVGLLRRSRPLWASSLARVPTGVTALGHEAVSSRVRMRTPIGSMTHGIFDGLDLPGTERREIHEARLLAELGITGVRPVVVSQFFSDDAPDLWLPMAGDDHDVTFTWRRADPSTATSVLGLLLRDAARRLAGGAGFGLLGGLDVAGMDLTATTAHLAAIPPAESISFTATATAAVSFNPVVTSVARPQIEAIADSTFTAPSGAIVSVAEGVGALFDQHVIRPERYNPADALAGFRDALDELRSIPAARRARLTGETLDTASYRYDAWCTSIASRRLDAVRTARPEGVVLGAWGVVHDVVRRSTVIAGDPDLPPGTIVDPGNAGHVLAPSMRHASTAALLRAAWVAHGGLDRGGEAPFAVGLTSRRVRQALALVDGMRTGQALGALLGYELERSLHDAGERGVELDWMIEPLRHRFPLRVESAENADPAAGSERVVVDGRRLLETETTAPGTAVGAVAAAAPAGRDLPTELAELARSITDLAGSLDAVADLALAEAAFQLAGRNFERAAAATDMLGRAGAPPDEFDSVLTPRPGSTVESRLLVTVGTVARPHGWPTDRPRGRLAPRVDDLVAAALGPPDELVIRVRDGRTSTDVTVAELGLGALDVAADAAGAERSSAGSAAGARLIGPRVEAAVRRRLAARWAGEPAIDDEGPADEPAPSPADRARDAVVEFDPAVDAGLAARLRAAAAWHRTLVLGDPITRGSVAPRGATSSATGEPAPAALVAEIDALAGATERFDRWELDGPDAPALAERRVAEARRELAAGRPKAAAAALLGSGAVVTGAIAWADVPSDVSTGVADQSELVGPGAALGWLQDTGRVRETAAALDEAILWSELGTGSGPTVELLVAQSPPAPYDDTVAAELARRWVGARHPAPLGRRPVTAWTVAAVGGWDAGGDLVGVELDRWTEAIPAPDTTGGVAANLPAPDARPPNAILLAVPAALGRPWSADGLFATVDEAMDLARIRLVDLDAAARVPALLPAVYVEEGDLEEFRVRRFLKLAERFPGRWTTARIEP